LLLVVDANIIFSALITKSKTFDIFLINKLTKKFEFIAPEFLLIEVEKHSGEIIEKSNLNPKELSEILEFLKEEIEFIPFNEFNKLAKQAEKTSPHKKDTQYFALALKYNCPIWSQEKRFKKQSKTSIYSTTELLKELKP